MYPCRLDFLTHLRLPSPLLPPYEPLLGAGRPPRKGHQQHLVTRRNPPSQAEAGWEPLDLPETSLRYRHLTPVLLRHLCLRPRQSRWRAQVILSAAGLKIEEGR